MVCGLAMSAGAIPIVEHVVDHFWVGAIGGGVVAYGGRYPYRQAVRVVPKGRIGFAQGTLPRALERRKYFHTTIGAGVLSFVPAGAHYPMPMSVFVAYPSRSANDASPVIQRVVVVVAFHVVASVAGIIARVNYKHERQRIAMHKRAKPAEVLRRLGPGRRFLRLVDRVALGRSGHRHGGVVCRRCRGQSLWVRGSTVRQDSTGLRGTGALCAPVAWQCRCVVRGSRTVQRCGW